MKIKQLLSAFFFLTLCQVSTLSAAKIALVSNTGDTNVTLINTDTDTQILNVTTGSGPVGSAVTPNGQKAYVANNDDTVTVIDLTAFPPTTTTLSNPTFNFNGPQVIAITPDGSKAYVTNFLGNSVTIINTSNDTLNTVISSPLFSAPVGIAITPDGKAALVAGIFHVTKIDLATNALSVINSPDFDVCEDIAVKPDGTTAYVTNIASNNVVPIDLATFSAGTAINVFSPTFLIAINPSGTKAYATSFNANVPVINLINNTFSTSISGFIASSGVAFIPDGKKAYVTDLVGGVAGRRMSVTNIGSGTVVPILVQNDSPQTPITGFLTPSFISVVPDQAPTARFTFTTAPTGSATIFDASASSSPDGFIEIFAWDFGDGNTAVTSSPTISHVYTTAGPFTVTLTVTNSQGTSTFQTFTGKTVSNNGGPSAQVSHLLNIIPAGPTNFKGVVIKNKFLTQTDYIHHLTWTPSSDPNIVGYSLFRNGKLIATIPATGPFEFNDHDRKNDRDTYTLIAFDSQGFESAPVTTTVPNKKMRKTNCMKSL